MDYSEFVSRYHANQISVSIDKNKAGYMYERPDLMPQRLRTQQVLIRTMAFGGVLLGIVLFFFAPWWAALAILIFGLFMFPQAQRAAAKGVLIAALENPYIYQLALENNVLVIQE